MTHERSDVKPLAVSSCSESTAYILLRLMGLPRPMGAALVAAALVAGCGSSDSNPGGSGRTDGGNGSTNSGPLPEGGGPESTSLSNLDGSAGSIDSGSIDASPINDSLVDASGSASVGDGATGANADGSSSRDDSEADVPATFFERYEAESAMNTRSFPVEGVVTDGAQPCSGVPGTSSDGVKEGADCASGGHVVNQVLGRSPCTPPTSATSYTGCGNLGGGVTFNGVTVPADGTYDVTFWYHSGQLTPGKADVYGDAHCGGVNYDTGAGSGCRPHLILVNGVQTSATVGGQKAVYYEFPAYPDSWAIVHGAVVALSLRAGPNMIEIKAPGFTTSDAADIDALDVQPSGAGAPSFQPSGLGGPPALRIGLVTPVVNWN